jgi:hypothetical protein
MFFDILVNRSPLAQLVEQLPYMEKVVGSNPTGTTHFAAIVYRLGPMVFIHKSGVRFPVAVQNGGIAQLARASALHAEGHGFESLYLHNTTCTLEKLV